MGAKEAKLAVVNAVVLAVGQASVMSVVSFMYYYGSWLISVGQSDFTGVMIPLFMMIGAVFTIIGGVSTLKDPPVAKEAAGTLANASQRSSQKEPNPRP